MIVEIRGTKTENKGAELMLRAVVEELRNDIDLAVEPMIGNYTERATLGLQQKFATRMSDRHNAFFGNSLPSRVRRHLQSNYGIIFERDIDAVLDAWGFAYSDQFDVERCEGSAARAERWKRQGKKVIVMPQAFGPFTSPRLRAAFSKLLDNTDLVFARERASYNHVMGVEGRKDHVRLAPDFTCRLHGIVPSEFEPTTNLALVVPSTKLLTHSSPEVQQSYVPFLLSAISSLRAKGLDVRMLVHETSDNKVVELVQSQLHARLPEIHSNNALHLKGIIGQAHVVISSRFHALVSALTQAVPAMAIGWSHKYEMLFDDYGCRDLVVDPSISSEVLDKHLSQMLETDSRDRLVSDLRSALGRQQDQTAEMWREVRKTLRIQ